MLEALFHRFSGWMTTTQHMLPAKFILLAGGIVGGLAFIILVLVFLLFKNRFLKSTAGILALLWGLTMTSSAGLYIYISKIEPNWIRVEYVDLKIPNLAEATEGMKIVQFSDLHVFKFGYREQKLIEIINSLEPDLILFTGGFTGDDFENMLPAKEGVIKVFSSLKANIGIYAVEDDTDYDLFNKDKDFDIRIKKAGIKLLFNEPVRIHNKNGKYFWLIGVEDSFYTRNGVPRAMLGVPLSEPKIMITHSPTITDYINDYKIELILVGKTHGGHVGIPFIRDLAGYVKQFKYIAGLYELENGTQLYVNRGAGVKTSPYRFMCRPEVTVFRIKK